MPLDFPHSSIENPHGFPLPIAGATLVSGIKMYSEVIRKGTKDKLKIPQFAHGRLALSINHTSYMPRLMWFEESDTECKFPVAQVMLTSGTVSETKNSRDGFKHCLRIDLKAPSQADIDAMYTHDIALTWGLDKVVLGFTEQKDCIKWTAALSWAFKAQTVVENHVAFKSGHAPSSASTPVRALSVDHEAIQRASALQAQEEMLAEEQALAREQHRLLLLQREAETSIAQSEEEARRLLILQKLEQEDRELQLQQNAANTQVASQPPAKADDEALRTRAIDTAGRASTVEEAEMALARMEMSQPPPASAPVSQVKGRRNSVTPDEWTIEKTNLVAKIMCLKGSEVWKFAREKILKQKWENPAQKSLIVPGKGFMAWTGRKPVRFTSVTAGPSEALNLLM